MFTFGNRFVLAILAMTVLAFSPPVLAQESDAEAVLEDFIHYALIANVEFAEGNALALTLDGMTDEAFYEMVVSTRKRHDRFDRAIGWAMFVVALEPLAARLEKRFEVGRTSVIRNADRLKESIALLQGTTRQRLLAKERLAEAGEYAVPHLLRTLHNSSDSRSARNVKEMLAYIGKDAVLPLSIALPHIDDESQILIARVLGEIGYPHCSPALVALINGDQVAPKVRQAANAALNRIGIDKKATLTTLQTIVAMQFYSRETSVLPEAVAGTNIFWMWDPTDQLIAQDVPEEVYDDVMAMYFASEALASDPENAGAMSVFVAANLRRDRELEGRNDLVYGNLPYSPAFYATVFGPEIAQHVLARAISDFDTPLALDAITALSKTAGADSLIGGVDKPLVRALNYPDRRVQYEAAMTLASTLPTMGFSGDYRVVPILASAVRSGGDMFAIVIGDDSETRRTITTFLEANGWKVVGQGISARFAVDAAGVVPGIDLAVIVARNASHGQSAVRDLAALPETTVTPALILARGADAQILSDTMSDQNMVETAHIGTSDSAKLAVLEDLLASASGGRLSMDEQFEFSTRALGVLRDIALADTVLKVGDATGSLIDALSEAPEESQPIVALTLGMINDPLAQRALIDAALTDAAIEHRVMLLDEAAGSVRRWGNLAQDWQIEAVVDLAENASGYLADAAARLNGALDHPDTSVMMFLP
jgi:HEAT repeat protein